MAIVCTTNVYLFSKGEGWKFLKWENNKDKDFNLVCGGWITLKRASLG